ncbi:MAG: hypothetical protein HKN60_08280 [Rhizobiales bacterium]|nr:hypothetical protein [Hyphomicrobiales bacterium]
MARARKFARTARAGKPVTGGKHATNIRQNLRYRAMCRGGIYDGLILQAFSPFT